MTLRGFLLWYVGAVVYVGAAGATGYQALTRLHLQSAANRPTATPSGEAVAMAQPQPRSAIATPPATSRSAAESPRQPRSAPPRQRSAAAIESNRHTPTEPTSHPGKTATEREEAARGKVPLPPIPPAATAQHPPTAYRSAQQTQPRQPGVSHPKLPPAHQVITSAYPGVYAYQPSNVQRGYPAYPPGYPYPNYSPYQSGYAYPNYGAYQNGYAYYAPYQQYGRYRAY